MNNEAKAPSATRVLACGTNTGRRATTHMNVFSNRADSLRPQKLPPLRAGQRNSKVKLEKQPRFIFPGQPRSSLALRRQRTTLGESQNPYSQHDICLVSWWGRPKPSNKKGAKAAITGKPKRAKTNAELPDLLRFSFIGARQRGPI